METSAKTTEFVQHAMKSVLAPHLDGLSVKSRLRTVGRKLPQWKASRIKCAWYADPDMSLKPHEISQVESVSGLNYGDFIRSNQSEQSIQDEDATVALTRQELMLHLERLANVGIYYAINDADRRILRMAANEIGDVGAAADMYRRKMEECAKMLTT